MQKLRERTAAVEGRVSSLEDDMAPLQRKVKHTALLSAQQAARLDDLENRMRRSNIRAIGIPERVEGKDPVAFIEQWLLSTFGQESFTSMFSVERAHRVPMRPLPPGAPPPRTFIFKFLNY